MLSAQTLGMIGGFNVLGSLFFGWAGQRWNKLALLGMIYILRSLALAWYFMLPATPASTLLFGAIMGFLWMGVGPLVAGAVAEMFGLKWQAMIQGLAFMSHQLGSFLGAYGGGLIYDQLGSYTMAWRIGVALGLAGGIIQNGICADQAEPAAAGGSKIVPVMLSIWTSPLEPCWARGARGGDKSTPISCRLCGSQRVCFYQNLQ
jgi:predicted MFS family arabinose efflux permease